MEPSSMERYDTAAQTTSQHITEIFSDSFSLATKLFPKHLRSDIYNIYGLVRLADEIADTYHGNDALELLQDLEREVYAAHEREFSSNPVVHAFCLTSRRVGIGRELVEPFFDSMRTDIVRDYTPADYEKYIYGSAEVVGLMCLKVFVQGSHKQYEQLADGARALGSGLQKVNFLRDMADDHARLGRYYFPQGSFDTFSEPVKQAIIDDIEKDFGTAADAIPRLPRDVRPAVMTAFGYYRELLAKLDDTPAEYLQQHRLSVPASRKLIILGKTLFQERFRGRD